MFFIIYIILGFTLLISGANLLVKGASNIAKRFNVPEILIGLTIVALGTSAPELIVTITSGTKGAGDLIIGNAIGSNLCNLLLILGLSSVIKPIRVDEEAKNIHIPIALIVSFLVLLMGISSTINKIEGITLLLLFLIYFSYTIIIQIKNIRMNNFKMTTNKGMFLSISSILIGIIFLKIGGDFVVNNSINIAKILNIGEDIIGLTIIAIGTSLPELVTSIVAIKKGDENLAVGNIVGSCIFNLLLILGVGAILTPLVITKQVIFNLGIIIVSTFLIWIFNFIGKRNYITFTKGMELLVIFGLYTVNLFVQ